MKLENDLHNRHSCNMIQIHIRFVLFTPMIPSVVEFIALGVDHHLPCVWFDNHLHFYSLHSYFGFRQHVLCALFASRSYSVPMLVRSIMDIDCPLTWSVCAISSFTFCVADTQNSHIVFCLYMSRCKTRVLDVSKSEMSTVQQDEGYFLSRSSTNAFH